MTVTLIKRPKRQNTQLAKKTSQLLSSVGTQIFWSFNGQSWTIDHLKALSASLNLGINIKDIPASNGMHNAISLWKNKSNNGILTAKKVHSDTDVHTIGILEIQINEFGKKAKGVQIDSICFDSVSKTFLSKGNTEYAKSLCDTIQHRITHYTGNEFRKWIIMPFLESVNAIRMMGGTYFIGLEHSNQIDALEKFCNTCGVTLHCLSLSGDDKTKAGVSSIAKQGINERIADLTKKLDVMKKRRRVRSDGREGIANEINELTLLANRIKKTLSANTEDIELLLSGLQGELQQVNDQQPTESQTSSKVLQIWKNAMQDKYRLGNGNYKIPFADFDQLLIPKTASNKFYWKPDQRLGIALAELNFTGKVSKTHLLLKPIS